MKKFKLVLMIIAVIFSACLLTGCGNNDKDDNSKKEEEKTVALILAEQFKETMKSTNDLQEVARKLTQNDIMEIAINLETLDKEDYISGFKTEIKDFKQAITIRPMIGTIPFVAYLFEVDNAEEFAENLRSNADLRWNICTEADDLEIAIVDNYVFFVMAPKSFNEE